MAEGLKVTSASQPRPVTAATTVKILEDNKDDMSECMNCSHDVTIQA